MQRRKSTPERGRCFSKRYAALSGPVAMDWKRLEAAAKNSAGEKGKQKDERDSSGHMARRSSGRWPLALLSRAFGWETKTWDLR